MLTGRTNIPRGPASMVSNGGIKKRRSGPARIDKDGDMVMDAITGAGRGSGRADKKRRSGRNRTSTTHGNGKSSGLGRSRGGSSRASKGGMRRAQQAILRGIGARQANILETVEITGISSSRVSAFMNGSLESLLSFLERKGNELESKPNKTIKIKKSVQIGESIFVSATREDISQILRLDKCLFTGIVLTIKPCPQPPLKLIETEEISAEARNLKGGLQEFLATRYNVEHKLLDLSMLGNDPRLQAMGLINDGVQTVGKLFPAIMAICDGLFKTRKEKEDAISSISLSDNAITSINHISSLSQTFPDIKNIDLSRNKIPDLKSMEAWRGKFRSLEIILLKDNPIEQLPELNQELIKRYPKLHTINDFKVTTNKEVPVITSAEDYEKTLLPILPPLFRDVNRVGETFIRHFLPLYDNDRTALLKSAYDDFSCFSIAINTISPRLEKPTPSYGWNDYTKYSRNIEKLRHLPTKAIRDYRGPREILTVWNDLPISRHPNIDTENHKYLFEGQELPHVPDPTNQSPSGVTGMIVTMHSEFVEPQNIVPEGMPIRSFSRTFILGPGAPGGPAIRVVCDMLIVRCWAPLSHPASIIAQRQHHELLNRPDGLLSVEQQRELMTRQLMEHTRMTMQYSILCLQQAEWNLQKAIEMFNQTKTNLPPDAFIAA